LHLFTLDKKLWKIQHRLSGEHLKNVGLKHNLSKEELQHQIQTELYQSFSNKVAQNIKISVVVDGDEELYQMEGYVLTARQMHETILECLDMEEEQRERYIKDIKAALGMHTNLKA